MKKAGKFEVGLMVFILAIVGCATIPAAISEANRKQIVAVDSLPAVVESVIDSVVFISKNDGNSTGSGVVLTKDTVVTAKHIVDGGQTFDVTLWNGKTYKVIDSWVHEKQDIGFLKIAEPVLEPAKFGLLKDSMLAEEVFVISSPFSARHFNTVTSGIISGLNRDWFCINSGKTYPWVDAFTIDVAILPGSSGGPVFTKDGVVRGIVVGGLMPVHVYCIPTDSFMEQ